MSTPPWCHPIPSLLTSAILSHSQEDMHCQKKKKIQWIVLYIINSITLYLTFQNSFSFNIRFLRLIMMMHVVLIYFCWLISTISLKEYMIYLSIFLLLVFQGDFCFYYKTCCDRSLFMHMSQNMYLKVEFLDWSLFLSSTWKAIDKQPSKVFCVVLPFYISISSSHSFFQPGLTVYILKTAASTMGVK